MKKVRLIANFFFYITRVLAIMCFLTAVYAGSVVLLYQTGGKNWVPMHANEEGTFTIFYPFTKMAFLLGDYNRGFLVGNLTAIFLYAVFIWLLSGVFNAFRQERMFTSKGVGQLSRFYLANFILPVVFVIVLVTVGADIKDAIVISLLHVLIGIFAFFMSAIFEKGLVLQEEQDLTL